LPRRVLLVVCALTVLLGGCASKREQVVPRHAQRMSAILRWGVMGITDVPTLDPALASDSTSISVASLIYGGLVRFDGHLRVRPDGASHWTISRDGKVYTFYLRHDLRFADGRRATAADFAWALDRALGPEGSEGTAPFYLSLIARQPVRVHGLLRPARGITPVNSTTLRITLRRPAAHFLAELAFPMSYVPDPSVVRRYGDSWTDHASGFGPFRVRVWRHSRNLELVRNPYYYAGKPRLKRISLHFFQQQEDAVAAYRRRALDVVSGLQPGETLPSHPAGARTVPALALDYLAFNTTRLPFYRLHARQAFSTVWTPKLAARAMAGAAFAAHTFLPPTFGVATPTWHPALAGSAYLAQARYPHGRRFPRIALILPRDPHVYALAEELRRAWRASLGLDIMLQELDQSDYTRVLDAHAFALAIVRWGADYPDPQDFLGTQLGNAPDNITGWAGRGYDRYIALADSYSPNDPRRNWLFQQAAQLAARKVPILPLDEPAQSAILSPRLTGVQLSPLGTLTGDWARVTLSE